MTDKNSTLKTKRKSSPSSAFRLEAARCRRGVSLVLSGIISVEEFNSETVLLKSHGTKVRLRGTGFDISVFENRDIEITGKVVEIDFLYGEN